MAEFAVVFQILAATVVVAAPIVLLVTLIRGDAPASITSLWTRPDVLGWPRGIQEEEPVRWGAAAGAAAPAG
jgi:hypothetical protein